MSKGISFKAIADGAAEDRTSPLSVANRASKILLLVLVFAGGLCVPGLLAAQPDASISYVSQFGKEGVADGEFRHPHVIAVDRQGRLLVGDIDTGRIQRCTVDGDCEKFMNRAVSGIAVDRDNKVLLTSNRLNQVLICDETGACSKGFGTFGSGPGQFNDPRAITTDSQGRIVIADRMNHRVQFCDYEGNCTAFGTLNDGPDAVPGEFYTPGSLVADGKGAIYVGETGGGVVSVCDESGACSARLGVKGDGVGQFISPSALGLTSRGDLVVLELTNTRIQVCDLQGNCVTYGEYGSGNGQFVWPSDFAMDEQDRIYVADTNNYRIQIFQITYNSPPEPELQINAGHSGAWFNPDTSGQGQLIDVEPESQFMFLAWFTFTDAASNNPDQQNYSGNTAELVLSETLGGQFDDLQQADTNPVGTVTVSFSDCEQGQMAYSIDTDGRQGTIPLQRLIPGSGDICEGHSGQAAITTDAVDINAGMDGAWLNEDTPGQGFLIDAHPNEEGGNFIFGGSFDDPQAVNQAKVGTMNLDFTDCSNAQLSYSLTDEGLANDMAISRLIPGGQALCEELAGAE
jgi:hypothetical protein